MRDIKQRPSQELSSPVRTTLEKISKEIDSLPMEDRNTLLCILVDGELDQRRHRINEIDKKAAQLDQEREELSNLTSALNRRLRGES